MNRYSFTGKGNILLSAAVSAKYGNKDFQANEPIAYFTDVLIDVSFSTRDVISRQGPTNLTADSQFEPSILKVENIKVSESLQSLLYKKQNNNLKLKTIVESTVADIDGRIYLLDQTANVTEYFIYDQDKNLVTDSTLSYDEDPETLEKIFYITGLVSGVKYTYFYKIQKIANSTYFLDSPTLPNIAAQINILGNLNNQTGEVVMHFNKLKLLTNPSLNFNSDAPFVDILEFAILLDKSPIEVNYYG